MVGVVMHNNTCHFAKELNLRGKMLDQECWLEMDLYWFEGGYPKERVEQLFDRLSPLWLRKPERGKVSRFVWAG